MIGKIADPVERAAEAQALILRARASATAAETLRNDAIRAARAAGGTTVDGLAAKIGVKRNVVIEALRPGRG